MDIWTASITLLLIMNPLGNLPIFLSVLRHIEPKRRRVVLARELIFALIIMLIFLHAGTGLLDSLGLRQEAVGIAGGIILFIIALRMIFPQPGGVLGLPAGIAAVGAWVVSAAVLMFSGVFLRALGQRGLNAIERLMGMILIMIAVQMFLDGIMQYVEQGAL